MKDKRPSIQIINRIENPTKEEEPMGPFEGTLITVGIAIIIYLLLTGRLF